MMRSNLGQNDPLLGLVFAFLVFVGNLAEFVGLEEDDLAEALVGMATEGPPFEGLPAMPISGGEL